jgi:hypothetical protein
MRDEFLQSPAYQQVLQMARKNKLYMRDAALALGISTVTIRTSLPVSFSA